ncbi:hypothetical protein COB64_03430 [Candidatus Wolfebacteria bacterium]|nr:MAG: hypothetical protein COB64_03430 [Candidatus Wolfebacteria bacterium]
MRKVPFVQGEFYHIYNRGVDKRNIFQDQKDLKRFIQSMKEFNTVEPIGSIYANSFDKDQLRRPTSKLVNFICYCLNPNHFHFILEQLEDNGISEFMKRLGGYTKYFNERYKRSGTLFQGKFKSKHINDDNYLLHLSAYINLNHKVHKYNDDLLKLSHSSWEEYIGESSNFCSKNIVIGQFDDKEEYRKFALSALENILNKKKADKELDKLLLE